MRIRQLQETPVRYRTLRFKSSCRFMPLYAKGSLVESRGDCRPEARSWRWLAVVCPGGCAIPSGLFQSASPAQYRQAL